MKRIVWICAAALVLFSVGCNDDGGTAPGTQNERLGWGANCSIPLDCREGLTCIENRCLPEPDGAEGDACEMSGECQEGLMCDPNTRLCVAAGDATAGEQCGGTPDCERGLICVPEGFTGKCQPGGETDIGGECEETTECVPGLSCNPDPVDGGKTCQAAPPAINEPFQGVECAENDAEAPVEAFFEVPGSDDVEFYRLPFPNDIRIKDGSPNMSGHPTPGPGYLGYDIVQRYLDAISEDQDRFGLGQTVYFRFSDLIDFESLEGRGENATLRLLNIDAESPEYDLSRGMSWQYSSGRQKYMCQNWLAVRPQDAAPLLRETTYAVILRTGITDPDGNPVERDEDFEAMLGDTEPTEARLIEPWQKYQPLRDYIADKGIDASTILSAAVFTTGDPWSLSSQLREAARSADPQLTDTTLCQQGATSPCDDGLEGDAHVRGCFDEHPDFHEIQGRLNLPVFQSGDAPYADDGGDIATSAGVPVTQGEDSVCTAMTVPKAEMPADGWPLLIYAHGTGGTYRNHVSNVSPMVSKMTIDGTETGMVVMGWDQVQHYNRRGESEAHPNELVFNYPNPDAAVGNFLQGAADIHAVVGWAESLSIPASESPTGEEIRIDPDKIYFMGHSQGGTTGPLALPFDQAIKGSVLSGAGADIRRSLRNKTSPADVRTGFMVAVQDFQSLQGPGDVGINHPVLSLLSGYFAPVDPLHYGQYVSARQIEATTYPGHVLHLYGEGDTYTPPQAVEMLSYAMRIPYIGPVEFLQGSPNEEPLPVSGNLDTGGLPYTGIGRQYTPDGYDGHFVAFRDADAMDDIVEFLGTALVAGDGTPTITD
ncbi:MAG: hypothetical protein ACQEVA_15480 [Myxococcota bacterium]